MIEKDYKDLGVEDIWTTNGLQVQFHAMKGKDGIPGDGMEPDEAEIFVDGDTIPASFFI